MARTTKPRAARPAKPSTAIPEAIASDTTPEDSGAPAAETETESDTTPEPAAADAPEADGGAGSAEQSVAATSASDESSEMTEPEPEPEQPEQVAEQMAQPETAPQQEPASAAPAPQVRDAVVQKVGFAPLVLGGVVAAALGFVAAYVSGNATRTAQVAEIAALSGRIDALAAQMDAVAAPVDLAPVGDEIARLRSTLEDAEGNLQTGIAALETRIAELEKAPLADGTLADSAIAAWERELDVLRAEIAAQQDRLQQAADAAATQLEVTRSEAVSIEEGAVAAARAATARAAATRIQAALDAGTPFDNALADLGAMPDVVVPDVLSQVATEGVATMAALQEAFPPTARAALAVARSEGLAGDEGGRLTAFLMNQFDVRSVTPRDGDTPDAILSRAEDALRQGRLSDALAEVGALPEVLRAEMSDWTALAETRAAAVTAANTLLQSTNAN